MTLKQALPLVCLSVLVSPLAFAQQAPPPPANGGNPPRQDHRSGRQDRPDDRGGDGRMEHGGMGIVPPGTWWRNPEVIKNLVLTADQQKRLDDIFLQSRIQLVHLKASLEEEQLKLEPVLDANPPDAGKALAQISHIADLRADLEKSTAKMLLGLRGVLTADQWTKLHMHGRPDGPGRKDGADGGRGGRRGQGGPGQGPGAPGGPGPLGAENSGPSDLGDPPFPPLPAQ